MTPLLTREDCLALDAADPLASFLGRFRRPRDLLYFDGNSLGMLPWAASRRVVEALENEWGEGLIESWTEAGWIQLPQRVGAKIASCHRQCLDLAQAPHPVSPHPRLGNRRDASIPAETRVLPIGLTYSELP